MTELYAVVNYDDRPRDDNEIEIIHVTDNLEYAEKLAFHYVKKLLPPHRNYGWKECRILRNYYNEDKSIYIGNVIVEYRIGEVEYDDECEEDDKINVIDPWRNVWAVVKIINEIAEKVEDIDEKLVCEC
jgi:hypothetical protein